MPRTTLSIADVDRPLPVPALEPAPASLSGVLHRAFGETLLFGTYILFGTYFESFHGVSPQSGRSDEQQILQHCGD